MQKEKADAEAKKLKEHKAQMQKEKDAANGEPTTGGFFSQLC